MFFSLIITGATKTKGSNITDNNCLSVTLTLLSIITLKLKQSFFDFHKTPNALIFFLNHQRGISHLFDKVSGTLLYHLCSIMPPFFKISFRWVWNFNAEPKDTAPIRISSIGLISVQMLSKKLVSSIFRQLKWCFQVLMANKRCAYSTISNSKTKFNSKKLIGSLRPSFRKTFCNFLWFRWIQIALYIFFECLQWKWNIFSKSHQNLN